jgi:hypothetical protein
MSVESIVGNPAGFQARSLYSGVSADASATGTSAAAKLSPVKDELSRVVERPADRNVSRVQTVSAPATAEKGGKPAGVVSHVVVSYNLKGEMRTKFEDSRNNVVYQIPSEMVAKVQDLMTMKNTSTNIKG